MPAIPRPLLYAGLAATISISGCAAPNALERSLVRYKIPGSNFPIANAVEIPAGATVVHLSGKVPPLVDKTKSTDDPAAYGGDTEGQTVEVLKALKTQLESMGLGLPDIVKMQVFLVADPAKGSKMDFAGFMKGYTKFFGTPEQPNLPARSAFQVAALVNPAWFVEIEVVAVRGAASTMK